MVEIRTTGGDKNHQSCFAGGDGGDKNHQVASPEAILVLGPLAPTAPAVCRSWPASRRLVANLCGPRDSLTAKESRYGLLECAASFDNLEGSTPREVADDVAHDVLLIVEKRDSAGGLRKI